MKRAMILQAGADALAYGGIADLDLNQIAEDVGLRPSSLRYYFKNREDLAEAIYLHRLDEIAEGLDSAEKEADLEGAIRRLCQIELEHFAAQTGRRLSRKPQLGEVRTLKKKRRARVGARFVEILEQANALLARHDVDLPETMPLLPAQVLLENLFWIPAWIDQFHSWEYPKVADDLTHLLCAGIAKRGASFEWSVVEDGQSGATSSRPRPDAFLTTATQLVSERGYRGTSIDEIAARLGLTKGSFYHHNSEKEALVQKCFEDSYERLSELQRHAEEVYERPLDRIATVLGSLVSLQMHQRAPIIRTSALPGLPSELRMAMIEGATPLDRWFVAELARAHARNEATSVDPQIATQYVSSGANATYDLARFYGYCADDTNIALAIDRLMHGFAK